MNISTPLTQGYRTASWHSLTKQDSETSRHVGIDIDPDGRSEPPAPTPVRRKFRRGSHLSSRMRRILMIQAALLKPHRIVFFLFLLFLACLAFFFFGFVDPIERRPPLLSLSNRFHEFDPPRSYPFANLENLIMVAGHSVYISSKCTSASNNNAWFLESYQKIPGQADTFLEHIRLGVLKASQDPSSLLLFSGGETRKIAGPRTEAQSYWLVAEAANWFGTPEVQSRSLTEESARDSFENLLFSVCRFRELTGKYPRNITVVGYDFKEKRFTNLHRTALNFPSDRFFYVGSAIAATARESAEKAEASTVKDFATDPYGCFGVLSRKRMNRDPFFRHIPYPSGCPEISHLFTYCGTAYYPGKLPW